MWIFLHLFISFNKLRNCISNWGDVVMYLWRFISHCVNRLKFGTWWYWGTIVWRVESGAIVWIIESGNHTEGVSFVVQVVCWLNPAWYVTVDWRNFTDWMSWEKFSRFQIWGMRNMLYYNPRMQFWKRNNTFNAWSYPRSGDQKSMSWMLVMMKRHLKPATTSKSSRIKFI